MKIINLRQGSARLIQCCPTQLSILTDPNLRNNWRCEAGLYRTGKPLFSVRDAKSAVWLDDPSWHQPWEQFHFLPAGHFHKCQVLGNTMYGISSKPLNDLICIASFVFLMLFLSAIHFRLKNNNHTISQEIGLSKSGLREAWSSGDLSRQTLQPCSHLLNTLFHEDYFQLLTPALPSQVIFLPNAFPRVPSFKGTTNSTASY